MPSFFCAEFVEAKSYTLQGSFSTVSNQGRYSPLEQESRTAHQVDSFLDMKLLCIYPIIMDHFSFSWDNQKNLKNQKKHGVSFEEAQSVFLMKMPLNSMTLSIPRVKVGI